ncbi:MAG: threonine--tRNA ligase [SAR324 cluster bacterium]|nr:threonine--tRNA ligase [SAR324 cluster bacterium]
MEVYIENLQRAHALENATAFTIYKELIDDLGGGVVGVLNNGEHCDWHIELKNNDRLQFLTFADDEGKYVFWHSSAHILAQAILRHYPQAKLTIGPPIKEGFYYDFDDLHFSEQDFTKIEQEAKKIIAENLAIKRQEYSSIEEARNSFSDNPYKLELIDNLSNEVISAYQQGEFIDLCRGGHVLKTGKIKAFKLLKTAAAFWRGDSKRASLTRVYGISFPSRGELKDYLTLKEEALKRDHRVLGKKHNLFSFQPEAPGMPFIHPKGMIIWHELLKFWKELHDDDGYLEIKTPGLMRRTLWEKSGHWENYLDNMYLSHIDDDDYAIKPMNCPGCCLFFNNNQFSYRDLPIRIAEIGSVYRHELSGVLSGLFRVRSFHQDDSHIFMTEDQIETEIRDIIVLSEKIYRQFNLSWHLELSTKPDNAIGSPEVWDISIGALKKVLDDYGKPYKINEGDGAFYGPKIDMHIQDSLNRNWQCGTIQLDMNLPERFNVLYNAKSGTKKRPIMVHRAIYGSIERFFGILIEHFSGKFPLWLSPEQVRILPIVDQHIEYSNKILEQLKAVGLRASLDDSVESLSKKIKLAQIDQVNYLLIIGDKEVSENQVTIRKREDKKKQVTISIDQLISQLLDEYKKRIT